MYIDCEVGWETIKENVTAGALSQALDRFWRGCYYKDNGLG